MARSTPTLHLMCGKIAAGKSTFAVGLASAPTTILIVEDRWLARSYRTEMTTVSDYVRCSARLRDAIGPHVESLLRIGTSVVLDIPANTIGNRTWMRGLFERAGALHQLHYVDAPDQVCKSRLRERNAAGTHDFAATDADFERITSHFIPPPRRRRGLQRHPVPGYLAATAQDSIGAVNAARRSGFRRRERRNCAIRNRGSYGGITTSRG